MDRGINLLRNIRPEQISQTFLCLADSQKNHTEACIDGGILHNTRSEQISQTYPKVIRKKKKKNLQVHSQDGNVLHNIRPEQNAFFLGNYEKTSKPPGPVQKEACVNRGIGHGDWMATI